VFADLGFTDGAERQAKLRLAYALNHLVEARNLSQAHAARVLRLTQPKVSALRHYKLSGFSIERLMNLLTALDQDVEIVTLRNIARELVETVRKNVTIDWTLRENVRAQLRVLVKRILRKHGYPPDKQEKATQTVLEQAALLSADWAVV
jgi:predicted XRE-type DNA-binding protein